MKRAVIFGVTGQDGSYLSDLLLSLGYKVTGVARRTSCDNTLRLAHLLHCKRFNLVQGDITDVGSVYRILNKAKPHEVYNLAAQSHVWTSFDQPGMTWDLTGKGCLNILEVIRDMNKRPRFYQASSSEMFGDSMELMYFEDGSHGKYQDENTAFNPQSPYAIAKLAAHHATGLYRRSYDLFACSGILFNHESERRGDRFVTRKVTRYVADLDYALANGEQIPKLRLGNLYSERDWGHAEDYVKAMFLMLQQDKPDDYVVATGETHSVEEFVIQAFKCIGIYDYEDYITIDEKLYRPSEVPYLRGSPFKANDFLDWKPETSFTDLVRRMVHHDIQSRSKYGTSEGISNPS